MTGRSMPLMRPSPNKPLQQQLPYYLEQLQHHNDYQTSLVAIQQMHLFLAQCLTLTWMFIHADYLASMMYTEIRGFLASLLASNISNLLLIDEHHFNVLICSRLQWIQVLICSIEQSRHPWIKYSLHCNFHNLHPIPTDSIINLASMQFHFISIITQIKNLLPSITNNKFCAKHRNL